jgi:long-chain fatty acid transport protein
VAYKVLDNLSVSAGFTYMIGTVTMEKSIYTGYAADTYVESKLEADGNGMGFNVGVQYKPMDGLTLGAVYRHNVTMSFKDGDATFEIPELKNTLMYQALKANFPNTKGSSDLTFPNLIGLGVSYAFTEQLTAEFNFMQLGWSSYDVLKIKFKDPVAGKTETESVRNYEDSYSLRFGLEYKVNDRLAVRAGYLRDNHAVPDEYVEPSLPEGDRNLYSVGVGYKINNITLDAYYMFLQQEDRTITNSNLEVNGQPFPFNGTYKGLANMFGMTIGISL